MRPRKPQPLDVALVGMACRFPGAADLVAFWENVTKGHDSIGEVPPHRRDSATFFDAGAPENDRVYGRRGGYLDEPISSDPAADGIMPAAVDGGEPEQFHILDTARAALADAGLAGGVPDGSRVEVIVGRGNDFNRGNLTRLQHGRVAAQTLAILRALHPEWTEADFEAIRTDLKASLPPFGPATVPGQLTDATTGRLADRLDLRGARFVVDADGASALVALDLGARSLRAGRADLALVGAVYLAVDFDFPMVFSRLGALSRTDRARPFSAEADGTLPGEGVGVVVLKRLADAERDGDRIYAVLKGVGLASDGRGLGLASPSARGHALAIRRAYRRSGIDPATVGLVEGHGLGVPAADRAELRALRAVYPRPDRGHRALGAVSSMIGHTMSAAGMAGLIKAALSLHHRLLPPTLHGDPPHPLLAASDSPFALNPTLRPWIQGEAGRPRRAGVNASGFSGINAHAILEEHAPSADGETPGCLPRWETEAILLGAADRDAWVDRARGLLDWLGREPDATLKDLAFTINLDASAAGPFRVGLVAGSLDDLADRLRAVRKRLEDPACRSIRDGRGAFFWEEPLGGSGGGRLAFLFPGEGSQYPNMLADLCPHFPEVRARFDIADRVAIEQGHSRLPSEEVFGPEGPDPALWAIGTAVNVVLSGQWALYQLLTRLGLRPDAAIGHSSGEFLALAAAGVLEVDSVLEDRLGELGTIFERMEGSGDVPNAGLVAIAADRERVEFIVREASDAPGLVVAMDNCPHQVVLAGPPAEVEAIVGRLRARGILCEALPFDRAYHTDAFGPAVGPLRAFFDRLPMRSATIPLYTCATAEPMPIDVEQIRTLAVDQWTRPVQFRAAVERMHADGVRIFVDVGTRGNLAGFVEDTLRGRPHFAVAANLPRRSGPTQLNHLVASLFAQGVDVRPGHLYARRRPVQIDLEASDPPSQTLPRLEVGFPEMRLSTSLIETLRSQAAPTNGFQHHLEEIEVPPADEAAPAAEDGALLDYLRTMDDFLETQRGVMEAYLATGSTPAEDADPVGPLVLGREPELDLDLDLVATEADNAPSPAPGPWVGSIQSLDPGRSLTAVRILDRLDDPVAEHHTIGGRRVSARDLDWKGLPVLPFTVMAEIMAEAAAVLAPGRTLVGLADVRAHKWIRYEEEPIALEIRARIDPDGPDRVAVAILNRGPVDDPKPEGEGPAVEGMVLFGDERPEPPLAPAFALPDPGPCRFTAEELYRDQWLFHGPALRALVEVGASSMGGIEGTLRVLPHRDLLRPGDRGGFLTDPIVLDAFTHLLGCWGLDKLAEGDVIFPLRLGSLELFGPDPPEGSEVACRIAIPMLERHRVRVESDLVLPDGRVWMRIRDWEDWRFHWPGRFRDHFRMPAEVFVGVPLDLPGSGAAGDRVRAVWLEPPADMARPVWRDVLEWVQFGPEERAALRAAPGPDPRRTLRLWGRIAAKEAVRRLWVDRGDPPSYPADLAIEPDGRDRPIVRSRLEPDRRDLPAVSIAHTEGVAVALAALDPAARVGIDVERIERRSARFEEIAFPAEGERACLDRVASPAARDEWVSRFWAAKEAVAKATGLGLIAGPASVAVVAADAETGELAVALGPELRAESPGWDSRLIRVVTARQGEYAWAWTLGEPTARDDEIGPDQTTHRRGSRT